MLRAGIVGISGYSGGMILKILLKHPSVRVTYVSANNTVGPVSEIWPVLKERTALFCEKFNLEKAAQSCDVVFLAVPHTASMEITPHLLKQGKKVIDISGDYRLKKASEYKKWYGVSHRDKKNLTRAVYGLPEIFREKIKKANLISNPGCYPTAAILGLAPLVSLNSEEIISIIIDAKSGTSGAGKKAAANMLFSEVNENFKAYKVGHHQHTPEIDQTLSQLAGKDIAVTFTPHLLPLSIGILETIYVTLKNRTRLEAIFNLYKKFYKTEPFVRVCPKGTLPEIKDVNHTNFCDIGLHYDENKKLGIIVVAIDNLIKGAAGQAVQNMNILFGLKEEEGLVL